MNEKQLQERVNALNQENAQLRPDANAASLMKKLKISVEWKGGVWCAWNLEKNAIAEDEDMNIAVIQCAAKARMSG